MTWLWPADWSWQLDGWIMLAGILCAVSAALVGNFLVLRRLSLLGDAISHAILPGLAIAFLVTASRSSWPMFAGAVIAGLITAGATQWIRQAGKVEEGASLGVVFTCLFALGLVLIVQAADRVDLDPGCVLYGAIETTPLDQISWLGLRMPRVVWMLGGVLLLNALVVGLLFKEFKISTFDPAMSTTVGIPSILIHLLLMVLVAITAVASFESVGNVLVVAMLVVPPAAAQLVSNRLGRVMAWSLLIAALSAVIGHWLATIVPRALGFRAVSTAAMIAVASGMLFLVCLLFGPHQGLLWQWWQRRSAAAAMLAEDLVGWLYRQEEKSAASGQAGAAAPAAAGLEELARGLAVSPAEIRRTARRLVRRGMLRTAPDGYELTATGREEGMRVVRAHRLWEQYLVERAEVPLSRIHEHAERFEHVTTARMRAALAEQTDRADRDPHGSRIPPEN